MSNNQEHPTRVQSILIEQGIKPRICQMDSSTHTATQAAELIGCDIGQVAKSLIFRGKNTGKAILFIVSGKKRIDVLRMESIIGEPIEKATPEFVQECTGYYIGGVAPVGFKQSVSAWMDTSLLLYPTIWASAGTADSLFEIDPNDLAILSGSILHDL